MKKFMIAILMAGFGLSLAGCGNSAEVPPATRGKVLTSEGFQEGIVDPSRFRLNVGCMMNCDRLYLVDASDRPVKEHMVLLMPKDQLNLEFDVRATMTIAASKENLAVIFEKLPATFEDGITYRISFSDVYKTYAQPKMRTVVRNIVSKYSITDVAANREAISAEVAAAVVMALADTPISIKTLAIADVQFPSVITKAKEQAKEREIAIETATAQAAIKMVEKTNELAVAIADQGIRLKIAETIKLENGIVAKSVTPEYLAYRQLEVQEALANSTNKAFIPIQMMGSQAVLTGLAVSEMAK